MKRSSDRPACRAAARALSMTLCISWGARDWPFLMFTGFSFVAWGGWGGGAVVVEGGGGGLCSVGGGLDVVGVARIRSRRGRQSGTGAVPGRHRSRRVSCRALVPRLMACLGGGDEGVEQRMPVPGRGLELGVELHADEPGVHALR